MALPIPGIDGVDWAATEHAYGPATDIPEHLAALRASDARVRAQALGELYNKLRHQGTLYPAAAVAAPILLDVAADPTLPARSGVVGLVAHLAVGYDEEWLPETIPIARIRARLPADGPVGDDPATQEAFAALVEDTRRVNAEAGRESQVPVPETIADVWWAFDLPVDPDADPDLNRRLLTSWLPYVQGWLACYDAVRAGVPLFERLLRDPDAATRSEAAYALAWFPEHAGGSVPALTTAVGGEPDPMVAATMLVALGLLAEPADGQVHALLDAQLRADEGWRRWGAAVAHAAVARRSGTMPPDRTQPVLAELARGIRDYPPPAKPDDRWPRWLFRDARGLSTLYLARLGPAGAQRAIAAVADVLPSVGVWHSLNVVCALLQAAFPDGPPDATPRPEALTPNQRQALIALADSPDARRLANTSWVIDRYKLSPLLPELDRRWDSR